MSHLPRHLVGAVVMAICIALVVALFLFELPVGNREIALVVLGVVIGWGSAVVQFHFGSSQGSVNKTEIMTREQSE